MIDNFSRSVELVKDLEGGFVNNINDPGGATNYGITLAAYREYRKDTTILINDLKEISDKEVYDIYNKYWRACYCDTLPSGIDYAVFDAGINSGPHNAILWLQKTIGVKADGIVGPITLSAVAKQQAHTLIHKYCLRRLRFMQGLSTWQYFGKGWSARVYDVLFNSLMFLKEKPTNDC